ncbi:helix-turn-helix domain-containing protein [Lactobacillus sp.]|uniref:helix-turn-helix domain-containing protein n=1 Tax=Lactobacillus sp. TaxID=1591 RepID=UPI003F054429
MKFSEQIKKLRRDQGLTQEELAAKVHVTRQAVSNWENDKNLPDLETLIVISQTFQLSLDELILGGTEMTDKLINDASETKRAKFNFWSALIGGGLMLVGFICFLIKANSVEYVDKQGFLHENFYLLPIGYLFLFSGLLVIFVSGVSYLCKLHKLRNSQN